MLSYALTHTSQVGPGLLICMGLALITYGSGNEEGGGGDREVTTTHGSTGSGGSTPGNVFYKAFWF